MGYLLFSSKMKMSELLLTNPRLVQMLPRLGIRLGFGDKSVDEVCNMYKISTPFFLLVCNVYTHNEYLPSKEVLVKMKMDDLVPYLLKSHQYYLEDRMASIEQMMVQIVDMCDPKFGKMLHRFFTEYKQEVFNHFQYEEKVVFPYINQLIAGNKSGEYHIRQFEKNHSNIEDKLGDLTNILIKYLPDSIAQRERFLVLSDILSLSSDLSKHSLIEDKILVPYVEALEKNGRR